MKEPAIVASVLGADYASVGQEELLVAGSAILTHPEGRAAAVAQLRRAITTTTTTGIHSNRDEAG
jgi:ribulose 1,5-bisphosphate carboxylase large subunit-like protein